MKRLLAPTLLILLSATVAQSALADSVGQTQTFLVNSGYDVSGATSIPTTLRAAGAHGYFYVDDRYWNSLGVDAQSRLNTSLNTISEQFDSVIYPRTTTFWGSENTPGIDGDPHVVVLMQQLISGSGGYFETIHNYTKDRASNSNAREMVFVNAASAATTTGKTYVAHEFQHLISFNQKELLRNVRDDIWLNEARSEYAITLAGYSSPYEGSTLQRRVNSFLRTPSDSLVDWPNVATDYAIASVFIHYLADRYGPDMVASTTRTSAAGAAAIDEWLVSHGAGERFGDVFVDWMVASFLNDRSVATKYGYALEGLRQMHVVPVVSARLSSSNLQSDFSASLKEWQPLWTTFQLANVSGDADLHVRLTGAADAQWYGAVVAQYQDSSSRVLPFHSVSGIADIIAPATNNGSNIYTATVVVSQGTSEPVGSRAIDAKHMTITAALGEITGAAVVPPSTTSNSELINGDLMRKTGESEIYVVWGPYRRYLPQGVLKLYGFENRPVHEVSNDVFLRYQTSNYVREDGQEKVYALWPDGTKHWMNITAQQWDASARDWAAIFVINSSEVAWYATGPDITR